MKAAGRAWHPPSFAVIRHPVMSCSSMQFLINCESSELASTVKKMLGDQWVDEALAIASPSLHVRLTQWLAGGGDFSALERVLARYLIRMSFRATPFGTFSCVTTWHAARKSGDAQASAAMPWPHLPSRGNMKKVVSLDSRILSELAASVRSERSQSLRYFLNDTLYERSGDYLYMAMGGSKNLPATPYHTVSADKSVYLDALIELSARGVTRDELARGIRDRFPSETLEECEEFVDDAINQQILVTDHLHGIACEDGLALLRDHVGIESEMTPLLTKLSGLISPPSVQATGLNELAAEVAELLATRIHVEKDTPKIKVDLAGELRDEVAIDPNAIAKGISGVISRMVKIRKSTKLDAFIKRFAERFGEAEVPVLEVAEMLDSLGFAHKVVNPPLVKMIMGMASPSPQKKAAGRSEIDSFGLLPGLIGDNLYVDVSSVLPRSDEANSVDLVAWVAAWESDSQAGSPLTEGSVLEILKVGRTSGHRIFGRFAGVSAEIRNHLTCDDDPSGPLVAELLHLPHPKLGNVCSRVQLTPWHLGIRAGAPLDSALLLSDLTVRASHGILKLRSKAHRRDVLLQMSNAHAYPDAPSVPLYRFLASIANQGDFAELPNLRALAPSARFVPGLICDGVVISRASWRVPAEFCARLAKLSKFEARNALRSCAAADRWPNPVALVIGDQVSPFNLELDWMVDELATELKRSKGADLKEVYLDGMRPKLRSDEGAHFHEILVPLRSMVPPRRPSKPACVEDWRDTVRSPWSNWAYLKLYVRPSNQDQVLRVIAPLLNKAVAEGALNKYFYIRYVDEQGEHLRLRLNLECGAMAAAWTILGESFRELRDLGLLSSVATDSYVRELERYGGLRTMELCESIFCADSVLVMEHLHGAPDTGIAWEVGLALLDELIQATGLKSTAERLEFARKVSVDFQNEFRFDAKQKKRIGVAFRSLPSSLAEACSSRSASRDAEASLAAIAELWSAISSDPGLVPSQIHRMRWSLVHMRANRIFNSMPRAQEAIVFDLLRRLYERDIAVGAKGACTEELV